MMVVTLEIERECGVHTKQTPLGVRFCILCNANTGYDEMILAGRKVAAMRQRFPTAVILVVRFSDVRISRCAAEQNASNG